MVLPLWIGVGWYLKLNIHSFKSAITSLDIHPQKDENLSMNVHSSYSYENLDSKHKILLSKQSSFLTYATIWIHWLSGRAAHSRVLCVGQSFKDKIYQHEEQCHRLGLMNRREGCDCRR